MEWVICFITVWAVYIVLGGLKRSEFKNNVWSGLFIIPIQLLVDTERIRLGFYKINNPIVSILGSSFFFTFGTVFVAAMLYTMYEPKKKLAKILHILFFAATFTFKEYIYYRAGALEYVNWSLLSSIPINLMSVISLSWFTNIILEKGKTNI